MFKTLIVLLLLIILISLGAGMFFMVRDRGQSKRPVQALTIRISLSLLLFGLLLFGYFAGLIKPHGVYPPPPPGTETGRPQSQ
jgi:hypothetical protein